MGGIDGKVIGMMGDLKRGRTVRSLCCLMKNYRGVRLVFIAPEQFAMEARRQGASRRARHCVHGDGAAR